MNQITPGTPCRVRMLPGDGLADQLNGHIVIATRAHPTAAAWYFEPSLMFVLSTFGRTGSGQVLPPGRHWVDCISADRLVPLRDPGDDAVDEMVQRVGSPRLEEVPQQ